MGRSIDQRPDSRFPVEALFNRVTFQIVAAGLSQERWVHGGHHRHQVRPVSVLAIPVCRRKQADQRHPYLARVPHRELQVVLSGGLQLRSCGEAVLVALPLGGERLAGGGCKWFSGVVAHQRNADRANR